MRHPPRLSVKTCGGRGGQLGPGGGGRREGGGYWQLGRGGGGGARNPLLSHAYLRLVGPARGQGACTIQPFLNASPQVDDFMAAYPGLPCNKVTAEGRLQYPLPKRGDFVRFVRRRSSQFAFDPSVFTIHLILPREAEVHCAPFLGSLEDFLLLRSPLPSHISPG